MRRGGSKSAQRANVAGQLLLDTSQQCPRSRIVLFLLGSHQVDRKSVHVIEDCSANFFVRGVTRPKVQRSAAGRAGDTPKRRGPKLGVFSHQKARPGPQILEELVELPMQLMVSRDLPVRLLDIGHQVNDLTQYSVEGSDSVGRW
jgi:hypothetical protein